MGAQKKDASGSGDAGAEAPRGRAASESQHFAEFQTSYRNAYLGYIGAVAEGQAVLQARYAETQSELVSTLRELDAELTESGSQAYRTLVEALHAATAENDAHTRAAEAYRSYQAALQQYAAAQRDAEQRAQHAYREYLAAVQSGQDENEVRRYLERAQEAINEVAQGTAEQNAARQQATEAEAAFYRHGQEAQATAQQAVTDAYSSYVRSLRDAVEKSDVQGRYQDAVQRYSDGLRDIHDQAKQIAERAQEATLEAGIQVLQQMQKAWEGIGFQPQR